MQWPNFFWRKKDENTREIWGYTFQWTPQHLNAEQMRPWKYSYDVLGDKCLDVLDKISPPLKPGLPRNTARESSKDLHEEVPKRDLYGLLRDHASQDETLGRLWQEVNTVPDWVDWEQISRGQEVFYRYGGVAITALTYQSLLGGMGASRVAETLSRTGGFGVKVARHRMYETMQHILQVTKSLESIKPGGAGHVSSIRVRLLHAAVRRRIMNLSQKRPEYFDVEKLGIPINDLDCIATIATFSATLIWLGFPRQGIWLRTQEIEDYLALWRLVAHYIGTPTECFSTVEQARCTMESILLSEINPTRTSRILANNIILSLQGQAPTYASRNFLNANARWLNGNKLADALGLGRAGWYYWALVAGQCIFFCSVCYTYRSIPYLDQGKIKGLRRIFYEIVVENKDHGLGTETNFDFKYIPEFHMSTTEGKIEDSGIRFPGIERRNLRTLIIATSIVCVTSWFVISMANRLIHALMDKS